MEQILLIYLEETELLLTYAAYDLKPYIASFLHQLHKLKEAPSELLIGTDGISLINLINLYVITLKKGEIDKDELFVQLLQFTVKSVLFLKRPEKLTYVDQTVLSGYKFNNN